MVASSNSVNRLLEGLHGVKSNDKGWTAICPDHDDRQNSLSIHQGDDGRVLLKCFAGCETEQVVEAMGLTMADLFEKSSSAQQKIPQANIAGPQRSAKGT